MEKSIIEGEAKVKRNENSVTSEIENEIVIMNLENGNYYALNSVGSRIWELIETEISVNDICSLLTAEFDVEHEHCEKAVKTFFQKMHNDGLIIVS